MKNVRLFVELVADCDSAQAKRTTRRATSKAGRFWARLTRGLLLLTLLFAAFPKPAALQTNPADGFYESINRIRLNEGLTPLGQSTLLTQAAQRHVDDIATRGTASHQ